MNAWHTDPEKIRSKVNRWLWSFIQILSNLFPHFHKKKKLTTHSCIEDILCDNKYGKIICNNLLVLLVTFVTQVKYTIMHMFSVWRISYIVWPQIQFKGFPIFRPDTPHIAVWEECFAFMIRVSNVGQNPST